jgi:hypothetical protein
MENVLSLTPGQQFFIMAVYSWMFIGFPVLVLRKLNQITGLLEAQVYDEEEEEEDTPDQQGE